MRLAALGVLAALGTAPLAAQAARQPARFAVTLQATIVERLSYERMVVINEDCMAHRTGNGGRRVGIRSLRPTTIEVTGTASKVRYRPSQMAALRVAATNLAGAYSELRSCRFLPPERLTGKCNPATLPVRRLGFRFRSGRNVILFGRPAATGADVFACGLDLPTLAGWLDLIAGRIDQAALLNGRAPRVLARASGTRTTTIAGGDPTLSGTKRTTLRWTLTFRRLP